MLSSKLKLKADTPVWVLEGPDSVINELSGTDLKTILSPGAMPEQVLLFARDSGILHRKFPVLLKKLPDHALLWIAYPKKSGSIQSDLIRDEGWRIVWDAGWEGVASISIDADWSALRFRHRSQTSGLKRLPPVAERKTEGIDYVKRTVQLPEDALLAMKPYKGLAQFFDSMSFSHKKEYAEAIAEAKKSETRARRINGMIEKVLKLKEQKENKKQ